MGELEKVTNTLKLPFSALPIFEVVKNNHEELVKLDHALKIHAYQLARLVIIVEVDLYDCHHNKPDFFLNERFFYEVYNTLAGVKRYESSDENVPKFRECIDRCLDIYLECTGFVIVPSTSMSQLGGYAAKEMYNAYSGVPARHFNEYLKRAINVIVQKKLRIKQVKSDMSGSSKRDVKNAIRLRVLEPAKRIKEAIKQRNPNLDLLATDEREAYERLRLVWNSYKTDDTFAKDSIYYDSVVHPHKHYLAFYRLCQFLIANDAANVQCLPLRTNWIPGHTRIDHVIFRDIILPDNLKLVPVPKELYWTRMFSGSCPVMEKLKKLNFKGSYCTDGVSLSFQFQKMVPKKLAEDAAALLKSHRPEAVRQPTDPPLDTILPVKRKRGRPPKVPEEYKMTNEELANVLYPYIHHMKPEDLRDIIHNCVFGDGGRRDIWTFVHYDSESGKGKRMTKTYTAQQHNKELRIKRHQDIRKAVKTAEVIKAEADLASVFKYALHIEPYLDYLHVHGQVYHTLFNHYCNTMTTHDVSTHPSSLEKTTNHRQSLGRFDDVFGNPVSPPPATYPLHRRLRFSSYSNQVQADARLARELRERFGKNVVLVLGNWVPGRVKHHISIRGKSWRSVFTRHGFRVLLVDEYLTSQVCPSCKQRSLSTFKYIPNPRLRRYGPSFKRKQPRRSLRHRGATDKKALRGTMECKNRSKFPPPYVLAAYPPIICHGLLHCLNDKCFPADPLAELEPRQRRLWNRDISACLCMKLKFDRLAQGLEIDDVFKRPSRRNTQTESLSRHQLLISDFFVSQPSTHN